MGASGMSDEVAIAEPKLKPHERWERTDAAFREIVERERAAREAKTAKLRAARLEREQREKA